jgi:hypothetical protein
MVYIKILILLLLSNFCLGQQKFQVKIPLRPAIGSLNGLINETQTFSVGTAGSDFNILSSGFTHTFNLPSAGVSTRGLLSTTAQTFSGVKTFRVNYPNIQLYSLAANQNAGLISRTNDGSGNFATLIAYGSSEVADLPNNSGISSSSSLIIAGNGANGTGGSTTIRLRPGGFQTAEDALVLFQKRASIGTTNIPNSSAILDIVGTTGGVLFPRMTTTQRNAISSPANGLQIYNTTTSQPNYRDATTWQAQVGMTFGTAAPSTTPTAVGNFFLDTTNKKLYVATGTASSANWEILN